MTHPETPDRRLQSAESPKQQAAASRETSRAADSVPVVSGQFANLPATFGRYQVERLLGRGAMGAVYLARDTQLDRFVALKIPKITAAGSKKLLLRLETEAKAAAQLDHPSLCKVHDAGEINGQCFIAMQYIEGETLKDQIEVKSKTVAEAVSLILQLAEGLSEAHALGIIHRDLKPENIMINRRGMPVIMDFGLAKFSTISSNAKATQAGTILGSPAYMSPEQASGNVREIDQRSDLYALGTILFELLTGQLPFNGSAMQILGQKSILDAASPLSLNPDLSPRLAAICHKMITRKSADRYQTLADVIADLRGLDLSLAQPVTDSPSVEASPFSSLVVSDQPVKRTARTAKRQQTPPAQGARDSSRSLKARFQQLTAWWKDQSPLMRRTSLGGAAFLVLCGVIIITIKTKDGTKITIDSSEASSIAISKEERKGPQDAAAPINPAPGLTPAYTPKGPGEQNELSPGMKFRWCPAGMFTMGSPLSEPRRFTDEAQVEVTLSNGFWLGETEVTQGQWESLMRTAPWKGQVHAKEAADYPASYVSYDDATNYCEQLTARERNSGRLPAGWKYALPTESQWEYACRAGTSTKYNFGDDENDLADYAWYDKNARTINEGHAQAVGKKRANAWGLRDMHGNVWEWCSDWYGEKLSGGLDPVGNSTGLHRVNRGGSWFEMASFCRSAIRVRFSPVNRFSYLGFRIAGVRDVAAPSISKVLGNQSVNSDTIADLKAVADPHRRFAHWVIRSGGALATKTGQWCSQHAMLPETPFTVAGADLVDLQMIPEPIEAIAEQLNLTWVVSQKNSPEVAIRLANKNSQSLAGIKFDGQVTDAMLAQLRGSDKLKTFDFYASGGYSEEGLKSLKLFPNLTHIGFNVGPLNDAGMAHLAGLQKIDDLMLWGTAVTDAGLVHLKGMAMLQSLQLGSSHGIAGPGILHLVGLPKLKNLSVHNTSFGDAGMEYIGKLPAIETLELSLNKITDAQLHRLDTLRSLKVLHLARTQVTDAGLAKLLVLGRVTDLGLAETGLTDAGLANLQRHRNLKRLYVKKTKVTEAAVIAFRKALPNCLIESDFSKKETSRDAIGANSPPRLATDPTKTGLLAEFFAGPDFDRKTKERIESRIDTTLYKGWVDDLVPPGKFSVRWTGFIKAPSTGLYELVTESDDGVRVWIDGKLVIDDWLAHPPQAKVEEFRFDDRPHSIKIEFWESYQGGYFLQLKWRKGSGALGFIPAEAFFQPPDRGR